MPSQFSPTSVSSAFNQRQAFNDRGVLFLVMQHHGGDWCVLRLEGPKLPKSKMVAKHIDNEAAAVATAERLRGEALT